MRSVENHAQPRDAKPLVSPDAEHKAVIASGAGMHSRLVSAALMVCGICAYLISRLLLLDSDQPPWHLVHYSSVDEFHYLMPAFNLFRHGSWTFQAASYAPVYGWPMNVWDNVVGWVTLSLWGNTYYGLRMGAVLMGLGVFLATVAAVRALTKEACEEGAIGPRGSLLLTSAVMIFMLVEFSMLVVSRVAEPTGGRMLALAVLLWLTARRSFFPDDRSRLLPTALLGLYAGASVMFVYVYNAFMIPAVFLAVVVWAWRERWRGLLSHVAALVLGMCVSTGVYFGFVKLLYGLGLRGWYHTWIASAEYKGTGRAGQVSASGLWHVLQSTLFRLNRPLLLLFLLAAGVFLWWAVTRKRPIAVLACAIMVMFEFQSLILSDYWGRKFVVVAPLIVIVIAVASAWFGSFRSWALAKRTNMALVAAGGLVVAYVYLAATGVLRPVETWYVTPAESLAWGTRGLALLIGGLGSALLVGPRRRWLGLIAGGLILSAVVTPSVWADREFIFGHPTYKYRDAMIAVGQDVDGQVTAGYLAPAMRLYNSSNPQLSGVHYGMRDTQYVRALVRFFEEGRGSSLFSYSNAPERSRLAGLGFKLVDTYDMNLPPPRLMGRYVFVGRPAVSAASPTQPGSKSK